MVHIKGADSAGNQILPLMMDDNYLTVMPGESVTVEGAYDPSAVSAGETFITVEGYNVGVPVTVSTGTSTVDKTVLDDAVSSASLLDEAEYEPLSWAAFSAVLAQAEELLADELATQGQVDEMVASLAAAQSALERPGTTPADSSLVQALAGQARLLDGAEYTEASWARLEAALDAADAAVVSGDPDDLVQAYAGLIVALAGLVPVVPEVPVPVVDRSLMDGLVDAVGALDEDLYTAASCALVESA
jgi:hypothetical protein